MATQLQIRRGTTSQMNAFTGAEGELAVNTTTDTVHVHDGSTAGGKALARADGSNIATYAGSFTTISASGAITGNVTGNLTGSVTGNVTGDVTGDLTGSILTAAQTNITSVGTLSTLAVSGALTVDTNTLVVDATNNRVGIGITPATLLDIKESTAATDAIIGLTAGTGGRAQIRSEAQADNTSSELSFYTMSGSNTSEVMRISGSNVGIGTSSPSSFNYLSTSPHLVVGGGSSDTGVTCYSSTNGYGRLAFADGTGSTEQYRGLIQYYHSDNSMQFYTGSDERMRLSGGHLLVGTTDDAAGAGNTNAGVSIRGGSDNRSFFSANSNYVMHLNRNTNDGSILEFARNGTNVGSILSSGGDGIIIQGVAAGSGLLLHNSNAILPAQNGNAVDATIDLGRSSPSTFRFKDLYLSGNASMASLSPGVVTISSGSYFIGNTSAGYRFNNAANTSNLMVLKDDGNLLVGKSAASASTVGIILNATGNIVATRSSGDSYSLHDTSSYKFYVGVDGGIRNFSANNVNLSDEREKKNIEALESQWNSLKQWGLKKFHYKADDDSDNKKYGVIAQEVENHNPEVISEFKIDDENILMAVKEQQMMWMAIKALQEAMTRIETLEAKVQTLENT